MRVLLSAAPRYSTFNWIISKSSKLSFQFDRKFAVISQRINQVQEGRFLIRTAWFGLFLQLKRKTLQLKRKTLQLKRKQQHLSIYERLGSSLITVSWFSIAKNSMKFLKLSMNRYQAQFYGVSSWGWIFCQRGRNREIRGKSFARWD